MTEVTKLLSQIRQGDAIAAEQLLPIVYDELRRLARKKMTTERPGQTLQATALVHEAYLRLVKNPQSEDWDSRGHFFAAAAEAMRRILIENARRKNRIKRGGRLTRTELIDVPIVVAEIHEDLLALDAALERLKAVDAQAMQLVQLRYFGGLSVADAAECLGISSRTADRVWAFARAWLHRDVTDARAESEKS